MGETRYTIRSEGGGLTTLGSDDKLTAMRKAAWLAAANPGQCILLFKDDGWVKDHSWCSGPAAEVQR